MKPKASRWNKWSRLSRPERRLLLQAAGWLPLIVAGLRLMGLRRTQSLLARVSCLAQGPSPSGPGDRADAMEHARRCAATVSIAARHGLVKANCLPRSILLWWLLRRRGIEADVQIGVRLSDRGLEAHAWVERDGVVLNDREEMKRHFQVLVPAASPR